MERRIDSKAVANYTLETEVLVMRLKAIRYKEFEGSPHEWVLEGLSLGPRNLIVGKNASGKSRALNLISALAANLAGLRPIGISSDYDVEFSHDGKDARYRLKFEKEQIVAESFSINDRSLLRRGPGGEGVIWAEDVEKGKDIRFQAVPNQPAAFVRRDAIQHKFLEPLYAWAASLRHYCFGSSLGKDHFAVFVEGGGRKMVDERDANAVVALYRIAEKEFKDEFSQKVVEDMREIDYDLEQIRLAPPISIQVISGPLGNFLGFVVKERGLPGLTDQHSMSQGMFRALSILIQVNYCRMAKKATCILVDDIGEGLDFDRSCRLIDLLRKKATDYDIQLIMSTNDRFVMNRVPLEEWSVLQRQGGHVRVRNYENSRAVFEEFKFTGLSNFSFLETDFLSSSTAEGVAAHE